MTIVQDQILSGERPLYGSKNLRLERVTIGEGESGLKESRHIELHNCEFEGMYVLWECEDILCSDCHFASSDRAPLWYGKNIRMHDCLMDAPKVFRELDGLLLENVKMTNAAEAFWYCKNGHLSDLKMEQAEYAFMQSNHLTINRIYLCGKYTFQYARNIEIHHAVLDTKDAFWNSEDCTIYDSEIKGEYLGWYAKNLRLVRCRISGTQPLCYCENLVIEDCTFAPDADLAFEHSSVQATILSSVTSIVNPKSGTIRCHSCGEYIHDAGAKSPDDCQVICSTNID
jgi:hypothetical protein